jgi:outer membrane protein TolC
MLRNFLILSFISASIFAAERVPVDRAIEIALENNPNIRNAGLEVEKAQERLAAQKTRRLPGLSFEAIGSEALNRLTFDVKEGSKTTHLEISRTFNMFAIAKVTQPITQIHKINLGIGLREASLAEEKEKQRSARQAIAREVKAAYANVVAAEAYADAAQDAVATYEEVEREVTVRVSQKSALEADRLDAAARLAATRATALTAVNTLATAKDQLNYLVGREIDVTPMDAAIIEPAEGTIAARPDVREAELRVQQAKLDARLKAADRIPDVSLMVSRMTPIHFDVLPTNITSAALTISYEPWTWGRRSAELAEKRRSIEQAENALRDRQAAAAVEIAAQRRKVQEAAAQVAVRHLELEATRERLRVTRARFHERAARQDEMYSATAALTQAAARKQEAISGYFIARADYEKAIGEQ